MSTTRRTSRMASLIRSELARVLIEEVSDPSLREVVITEVELSKDLKSARVFYAGAKAAKEADQGLKRALPFFRKRLGENLELRYVPRIEFRNDLHGEQVSRLMGLFDELGRERHS